jgi:hypothetical protein
MKKVVKVGFTGTRKGMSEHQKMMLISKLSEIMLFYGAADVQIEFHHGCCVGADVEADGIARNHNCKMFLHPSNDIKTRVHCEEPGDVVYKTKPPLVRDQDIVDAVDFLIAAPRSDNRIQRSGTWTTVRYFEKKLGVPPTILKR